MKHFGHSMILHLDKLESFVLDLVDTTNINIIKGFKFVHDSIFSPSTLVFCSHTQVKAFV